MRLHIPLGGPQGIRLRFTPALGDGLGKVGEEHREPQDDRDGENKAGLRVAEAE